MDPQPLRPRRPYHDLPRWKHPRIQTALPRTVTPMIPLYQAECDATAGRNCITCRERAITSILSPCSYLHVPNEPFINVLVQPTCGTDMCKKAAEFMIEEMMNEVIDAAENREIRCVTCWKSENVKRCTKCMVVAYCGTECQKKDWKMHKKICAQLANERKADEQV